MFGCRYVAFSETGPFDLKKLVYDYTFNIWYYSWCCVHNLMSEIMSETNDPELATNRASLAPRPSHRGYVVSFEPPRRFVPSLLPLSAPAEPKLVPQSAVPMKAYGSWKGVCLFLENVVSKLMSLRPGR